MTTEPAAAGPPVQRLKFLMRSGNAFMVDGVTVFEMRVNGLGMITQVRLEQLDDPQYAHVYIRSVDLEQIEAIVRLPAATPGRRTKEEAGN